VTGALAGMSLSGLLALACTSRALAAGDPSDPGFDDPGSPGGFGGFGVVFVLFALVGVGITIYKVAMARDMARKSGMDPDQATAMTLLSDDGLDATYLASNLRPPPAPTAEAPSSAPTRTTAERLAELSALLEQGLVTQAEYDERRAAILGSI